MSKYSLRICRMEKWSGAPHLFVRECNFDPFFHWQPFYTFHSGKKAKLNLSFSIAFRNFCSPRKSGHSFDWRIEKLCFPLTQLNWIHTVALRKINQRTSRFSFCISSVTRHAWCIKPKRRQLGTRSDICHYFSSSGRIAPPAKPNEGASNPGKSINQRPD